MRVRWSWAAMAVAVAALVACPEESRTEGASFWDTWGDAKAEVDSYSLVRPRYGEPRKGRAVLIYVAEPQTRSTRVKPEDPDHPADDRFYVLKLNHMRSFQTGVYPYRVLTSSFVHVDPAGDRPRGAPSKLAFTSQEWCGTMFHQLLFDAERVRSSSYSYFDGEADQQRELDYPKQALTGDTLFIALRGLFVPLLARGEKRDFAYLPALAEVRLEHKPLQWSTASVARDAEPSEVEVPAGEFTVDVYTVRSPGRPALTVQVETAWPHRIVAWQTAAGEKAALLGSERMQYWKLTSREDRARLEALGLR